MGQELVGRNFGHLLAGKSKGDEKFQPDGYYRLLEDDESKALNAGEVSECTPLSPADLGETLRRMILKIYSTALSNGGKVQGLVL